MRRWCRRLTQWLGHRRSAPSCGGAVSPLRPALFESLEARTLFSLVTLGLDARSIGFTDADGDHVTVKLSGPGIAIITLDDDQPDRADIATIEMQGTTDRTTLYVNVRQPNTQTRGEFTIGSITADSDVRTIRLNRTKITGDGVHIDGSLRELRTAGLENGADLILTPVDPLPLDGKPAPPSLRVYSGAMLGEEGNPVEIRTPYDVQLLRIDGDADGVRAAIGGDLRTLQLRSVRRIPSSMIDARFSIAGEVRSVLITGLMTDDSYLAAGEGIRTFDLRGSMADSFVFAGATLGPAFDFDGATFDVAELRTVKVRGNMFDSIIAAGGDPSVINANQVFEQGDVLAGGLIKSLNITGQVIGSPASPHPNPGVYAAAITRGRVAGVSFKGKPAPGVGTTGTGVIDPLPSPANALDASDVETILERAVRRAEQLGVSATISVVDREGNILGMVRMAGAAETVDINAGGTGGLEAVDGIVATSLISATKAGTAAFLSTSQGNAFTTRTAGHIIQRHFPPGVANQDSGPLFGVQLSSLPTSDVNRLPLGLSADPGGVPLYRGGELVGGIGVEVDGIYTVDPTRIGGAPTDEELIALAGQVTFVPPANIRADRIFIDGIRLDYANASPPSLASLGTPDDLTDLAGGGAIDILVAPRVSPASRFVAAMIGTGSGTIIGEVPDNALQDFYNNVTGELSFKDGDDAAAGVHLTADDVETILLQTHQLNSRLRAQIRRDDPQISHVTVSVVDQNGNLLGSFRSGDAPVFGYDVSVQKARTAAFFSRADAGAALRQLDLDVAADIALAQTIVGTDGHAIVDPSVDDPFGLHVDLANAIGVGLDGTVAVADRTGGFLSRPNLPDGIDGAAPGPLSAQSPDTFSVFNTGLQTTLIIPNLVDFLLAFNNMAGALGEAAAIEAFMDGTLGGPTVAPNETSEGPGVGLPGNSLANGMQIFAGSVPLYKDGVLVGGVGVSGDGIEQDDYVAFTGATGYQEFGAGVQRADEIILTLGIRLPYVKIPRSPFNGA